MGSRFEKQRAERLAPWQRDALPVKTRVFTNVFDKQIGMTFAPGLEGLDGRLMVQRALRDALVVGAKVLGKLGLEL